MRHGFTLVELAIVLVILGLLAGGVMYGQNLIRAAELRSVVSDLEHYKGAVNTFRDRYLATPGDMPNASRFWGMAANCPGTSAQGSTTQATCDGNGDGQIYGFTPSSNESYRFWQQLANAGLIQGQYSGVTGGASNQHTSVMTNSPSSKVRNGFWFVWNWTFPVSAGNGWPAWFAGEYGNRLSLGVLTTNGEPSGDIFTPEEMWNIDTKMDDGRPATGQIWGGNIDDCTDASSDTSYSSNYVLAKTQKACFMMVRNAF